MLNIHSSYTVSFFSLSCFLQFFSNFKWRWDSEFVLVILTSKKAFSPSHQNPLARTSGFALTPLRPLMISTCNSCNGGSISISLQMSVSNWASKTLTLLLRIAINPLLLQFNACVILKDCPHGHLDGSSFKSFPYRKFTASRKCFLFSTKLYSPKGTAESQFDARGSFVSLTTQSLAGERNCSIAAALIFYFSSRF